MPPTIQFAGNVSVGRVFAFVFLAAAAIGARAQTLSHAPDPMFHDGFEALATGPFSDGDAARFLAQATFGPTPADITHLRVVSYQGWLNEQFAATVSTQIPYLNWTENLPATPPRNNDVTDATRMQIWTINALGIPNPSSVSCATYPTGCPIPADQLRQRVAFALSEIFVVSNSNGTLNYEPWALASFYDLLAADAFGNYRTLLEDVTKHPTMGIFLSMIENQKADSTLNIHPDENYAREIMQLFSVGLNQLNGDGTLQLSGGQPVPTYDQGTVRGFAAVFTGWNWNNVGCGANTYTCCDADNYFNCGPSNYDDLPWQYPMQAIEDYHDNTSDKQLLKYSGVALSGGVLVHGGNAQTELTQALDNIFLHPNVGPFIAARLIQRLVTSNPTPAYVQRVTNVFDNNGQNIRGDLKAVVQAILLDPEARYGQWQLHDTFGKLREPLLKSTHLLRAMGGSSGNGRLDNLNTYPGVESLFGEAPLRSPTVFNFFKTNFQQPGELLTRGLLSPEFQILTDTTDVSTPNLLFHQIFCNYSVADQCYGYDDPGNFQMNQVRDVTLAQNNPAQLVDNYNLLFMSGQMSPFMRNILLTRLNAMTSGNSGDSLGRARIQQALYLIVSSPEYSIQK